MYINRAEFRCVNLVKFIRDRLIGMICAVISKMVHHNDTTISLRKHKEKF